MKFPGLTKISFRSRIILITVGVVLVVMHLALGRNGEDGSKDRHPLRGGQDGLVQQEGFVAGIAQGTSLHQGFDAQTAVGHPAFEGGVGVVCQRKGVLLLIDVKLVAGLCKWRPAEHLCPFPYLVALLAI